MSYWVSVKFDYCGDPGHGYLQEIKTNHYYYERPDGFVTHINKLECINDLNILPSDEVLRNVPKEEFMEVLKSTLDHLGANITNHKFL